VENLKGALLGKAPASHANIILGWKGLPGTNTLTYYKKFVNFDCKKFYNIGPWWSKFELVLKQFFQPSGKSKVQKNYSPK
jgi:hypothetical protein